MFSVNLGSNHLPRGLFVMLAEAESEHRALWSGKEEIKDHTCLWDQFLSDTGPFCSQLIILTLFLWPCLTARQGGYERKKRLIQWPLYLCLSLSSKYPFHMESLLKGDSPKFYPISASNSKTYLWMIFISEYIRSRCGFAWFGALRTKNTS